MSPIPRATDGVTASVAQCSLMNVINTDVYRCMRSVVHETQKHFTRLPSVWDCSANVFDMSSAGGTRITSHPCRSPHACAWCTPQITAKHRKMIAKVIEKALSLNNNVSFLTLTAAYPRQLSLVQRYESLVKSWKFLANSRSFKWLREKLKGGYIRVIEETFGGEGWSPHIHAILITDGVESTSDISQAFLQEWVRSATRAGLRAAMSSQSVDQIFDELSGTQTAWYLTKGGRFDLKFDSDHWSPDRGAVRPFLLLQAAVAQGDQNLIQQWNEYEIASKGKRRFVYSKRARELLDI